MISLLHENCFCLDGLGKRAQPLRKLFHLSLSILSWVSESVTHPSCFVGSAANQNFTNFQRMLCTGLSKLSNHSLSEFICLFEHFERLKQFSVSCESQTAWILMEIPISVEHNGLPECLQFCKLICVNRRQEIECGNSWEGVGSSSGEKQLHGYPQAMDGWRVGGLWYYLSTALWRYSWKKSLLGEKRRVQRLFAEQIC